MVFYKLVICFAFLFTCSSTQTTSLWIRKKQLQAAEVLFSEEHIQHLIVLADSGIYI